MEALIHQPWHEPNDADWLPLIAADAIQIISLGRISTMIGKNFTFTNPQSLSCRIGFRLINIKPRRPSTYSWIIRPDDVLTENALNTFTSIHSAGSESEGGVLSYIANIGLEKDSTRTKISGGSFGMAGGNSADVWVYQFDG